ncbi:hypothetical protein K504DRAFT_463191 [Pleomassaria siparia CBS 279.74]|uniref:Uncharacterized protein n=1 Tax=Pleomassaria siparia CBS 279.74 TaxID=1314801 RepID=A0A6G1JU99_9PLEO|nr:hypothetical protein K504DRAFT_463191 [Pleomassaria siparia CBS 279.74]
MHASDRCRAPGPEGGPLRWNAPSPPLFSTTVVIAALEACPATPRPQVNLSWASHKLQCDGITTSHYVVQQKSHTHDSPSL